MSFVAEVFESFSAIQFFILDWWFGLVFYKDTHLNLWKDPKKWWEKKLGVVVSYLLSLD